MENARVRENRLPRVEENYNGNIVTHQIPPVRLGEPGMPEVPHLRFSEASVDKRLVVISKMLRAQRACPSVATLGGEGGVLRQAR